MCIIYYHYYHVIRKEAKFSLSNHVSLSIAILSMFSFFSFYLDSISFDNDLVSHSINVSRFVNLERSNSGFRILFNKIKENKFSASMRNVYANLNCWCKPNGKNRSDYQSLNDQIAEIPKGITLINDVNNYYYYSHTQVENCISFYLCFS